MARGEYSIFTRYAGDISLRRAGPSGLISSGVEKIIERQSHYLSVVKSNKPWVFNETNDIVLP
jgi:hypothetical protein